MEPLSLIVGVFVLLSIGTCLVRQIIRCEDVASAANDDGLLPSREIVQNTTNSQTKRNHHAQAFQQHLRGSEATTLRSFRKIRAKSTRRPKIGSLGRAIQPIGGSFFSATRSSPKKGILKRCELELPHRTDVELVNLCDDASSSMETMEIESKNSFDLPGVLRQDSFDRAKFKRSAKVKRSNLDVPMSRCQVKAMGANIV